MNASSVASRAVTADLRLWVDWALALRRIRDNPYGAEIRWFGGSAAILAHGAPASYFNRVLGMTSTDLGFLDEIVTFYRERQTPFRIDVPPLRDTALLRRTLRKVGWNAVDKQANLAADLRTLSIKDQIIHDIEVREVTRAQADRFAEVYDRAYHANDELPRLAAFRRSALVARIGAPGWRIYAAYLDGELAGGGILHVADGVATLSGGATLPAFRRRGAQGALLRRRLRDATEAGCRWVVSRCRVGSTSQRNMERAGLMTSFTKTIWEAAPEGLATSSKPRVDVTAA